MQTPSKRLIQAILATVIGLAGMPLSAAAAEVALVDQATMRLTTSYLLRATMRYANGTISAKERITITNTSGEPISKVNLSVLPKAFGELTAIGSYSVGNAPTTARWTNNANLELQLGRNLADGETAVIRLTFRVRATGAIGTSLEGRLAKANGIMQISHWFPIISDGHGMRYPGDSQFTRTAKKIRLELRTDATSVKIAAPGRVVSSSGRDHVFELANARDFAFAASPNFRRVTGSAGGVSIKVYATSGSGSTALSLAKAAITKFESVYGQYQWPTYVLAQAPRPASGNEYPGIVFLGMSLLSNREVVAHETAHQWWYGMVGNDQIDAPWLDEGIAEFSASYFFGDFMPYDSALPVNTPSTAFPNVPAPFTSREPDSYDQTVYFKAARMLAGLRSRMGSTAFFGGMRALFADNRNGVLTTAEFVTTMQAFGAPSGYLEAFID